MGMMHAAAKGVKRLRWPLGGWMLKTTPILAVWPRLSGLKMDLVERFPVRVAKCTWEVRIAHFKEGGCT